MKKVTIFTMLILQVAEIYCVDDPTGVFKLLVPGEFDARTHRNYYLLPNTTECGISWFNDPTLFQNHRDRSRRSVNGRPTGLGKYLNVVRIFVQNVTTETEIFICTGSLINSRYVLTAGHCTTDLDPGLILSSVDIGVYDKESFSECEPSGERCGLRVSRGIEDVMTHEDYNDDGHNDIGIIRLDHDVIFTDFVRPICLPYDDSVYVNLMNKKVAGVGWGQLNAYYDPKDVIIRPQKLMEVTLSLVPRKVCDTFTRVKFGDLKETELCALGANGMAPCYGDSGGPLIKDIEVEVGNEFRNKNKSWRQFQVGITSRQATELGCGRYNVPTIYVNVMQYMPWILDNMRP